MFNGGSVHKNRYDEWYVLKTETCIDENGRVETIAHVNYGKGRDAYSTAREKLDDDYAGIRVEDDLAKMRIWDPNISQEEGRKNLINNGIWLMIPWPQKRVAAIAASAPKEVNTVRTLVTLPQFANKAAAFKHYAKHVKGIVFGRNSEMTLKPGGADMPLFKSLEEYVSGAQQFFNSIGQNILTKVRCTDLLKFDTKTGFFGVQSANGTMKTFFKPNDGINYFFRQ